MIPMVLAFFYNCMYKTWQYFEGLDDFKPPINALIYCYVTDPVLRQEHPKTQAVVLTSYKEKCLANETGDHDTAKRGLDWSWNNW